jgi:hypothetical protein
MAAVGFKQFGQPEVLREIGRARRTAPVLRVRAWLLSPLPLISALPNWPDLCRSI